MMKRIFPLLLAAAVAGCCAAAGAAASLPLETLPANTRWVLHLDVQALRDSPSGKGLLASLAGAPEEAEFNALVAAYAGDFLRELAAVTICGAGDAEQGCVVYLRGNWDLRKLSAVLADHHAVATAAYGRHAIMSWGDAKAARNAEHPSVCLLSANLVLLANRETALRQALDALDGKAPTLAGEPRFRRLAVLDTNAFLRVVAVDLPAIAAGEPLTAAALSGGDSLRLAVGLNVQEARAKAVIQASTPDGALQMQRALVGIQAVMLLEGLKNPDVGKIARSARIDVSGQEVSVVLTAPFEAVKRLLFEQKKGLLSGMNLAGKNDEPAGARLPASGP